jgi:hypothetical protein
MKVEQLNVINMTLMGNKLPAYNSLKYAACAYFLLINGEHNQFET